MSMSVCVSAVTLFFPKPKLTHKQHFYLQSVIITSTKQLKQKMLQNNLSNALLKNIIIYYNILYTIL